MHLILEASPSTNSIKIEYNFTVGFSFIYIYEQLYFLENAIKATARRTLRTCDALLFKESRDLRMLL